MLSDTLSEWTGEARHDILAKFNKLKSQVVQTAALTLRCMDAEDLSRFLKLPPFPTLTSIKFDSFLSEANYSEQHG